MAFLPIVERELRAAARRPVTSRVRWGTAGALILSGLILAGFQRPGLDQAQLGRQLFTVMAFLTMAFSMFAGVFLAADCLGEERREGTLGLLFLSNLSGADVVLGKLVSRSLNAIYALMGAFPVLALPLLMGGLAAGEFVRALLVILVTIFLSVSSSLMISAFCRESRSAIFWATGFMVVLAGMLPVLGFLLGFIIRSRVALYLSWASPVAVFLRAYEEPYAHLGGSAAFWGGWSLLMILGLFCLLVAGIWLPRAWQERQGIRRSSSILRRWRRRRFSARFASSRLRESPLSLNPCVWLATRDHWPRVQARLLCGGLLPFWALFYVTVMSSKTLPRYATGACFLVAFLLHGLLKCLVAMEATRRFSEDRQSGALEMLLVTPVSEMALVRGHLQGLRAHFLGFLVVLGLLNLALLPVVFRFPEDFGFREGAWIVCLIIGGAGVLLLDFQALAWVGMQQALKAKNPARALWVTVGRVMGPPWLCLFLIILFGISGGIRNPEVLLAGWIGFSILNACVWMLLARSEVRNGIRRCLRGGGPDVDSNERFPASGFAG